MKTKTYLLRRGNWMLWVSTLIVLFANLRGEGGWANVASSEPVWGRKPVLAYFALTASLAQEFKAGAGLTEADFDIVQGIARQEAIQLNQLQQTTQAILEDESLSPAEKRAQIAQSGYNQAVVQTISANQQGLQAALNPESYRRVVAWIEARWHTERLTHGLVQSKSPTVRTYSIFATHFDSNGSYAVALPDKCVKFADGGNSICNGSGYSTGNYAAQLSYDGETATVQSFDSGPWNVDDNFWATLEDPHPRRLYTDLPLGMPEAQAAYFDDYNDGLDQFDRIVTAPFAIDLGDEVGSDIGLNPGTNDWIDVTFLWTNGWDDLQGEVVTLLAPTLEPPYTGDMCVTFWHRIFPDLEEGGQAAYLTLNVDDPVQSTNSAEWKPDIPVAGEYLVRAFVPDHGPIDWLCPASTINFDTSDAEYVIHHANGQTTISKNQGPMANQYLDLGIYNFEAGTEGKVVLSDLNDEENLSHTIAFSAIQFRQIIPPPTPTATPSPTPTPTPTPLPDPYVQAGFAVVEPSSNITLPIHAGNLQSPGLGQAIVDVHFDPVVVGAISCLPDPAGIFDTETCQPDFEADGVFPDVVRLTVNSVGGIPGDPLLANLTFQAIGASSAFSWLEIALIEFMQPGGGVIPADPHNGMICIVPCENIWFLPVIWKGGQ